MWERKAGEGKRGRESQRAHEKDWEWTQDQNKNHRECSYESRVLARSQKSWVPVLILVLTHCDMWSQFKISLVLIHSLRLIMLNSSAIAVGQVFINFLASWGIMRLRSEMVHFSSLKTPCVIASLSFCSGPELSIRKAQSHFQFPETFSCPLSPLLNHFPQPKWWHRGKYRLHFAFQKWVLLQETVVNCFGEDIVLKRKIVCRHSFSFTGSW